MVTLQWKDRAEMGLSRGMRLPSQWREGWPPIPPDMTHWKETQHISGVAAKIAGPESGHAG